MGLPMGMGDSRLWQLLLPITVMGLLASLASAADIRDFDWESITPSSMLSYEPCYQDLQCARLIVPLDWQNSSNPHNVVLAIAKLPAKVSDDNHMFGGTIFTNPGGPGGSGIDHLLRRGHDLQVIAGNQYEILSWDPRGVGHTSPGADCYRGDIMARDVADIQAEAIGPLDASDDAFRRRWAGAKAAGQMCQATMEEGSILPYLSTASVVKDMVAMLDQVHALKFHAGMDVGAGTEKVLKPMDVPRIMYWGFSYGSILGNTFASMYPGRVGRMILDGIADADDYVKGTWLTNLQDADAVLEDFYRGCFSQDRSCSLKKSSDTKWEDIKNRVDGFITQTTQNPITIIDNHEITLITGADIQLAFIPTLYAPLSFSRHLSDLLNDALGGNYTLLRTDMAQTSPRLHDYCAAEPKPFTGRDAAHAIKCADGEDETNHGVAYFQSYLDELKSQSQALGQHWTKIRLACSGWSTRPKWRFTGPFTTPEPDASLVEGKPAAPILFLSSRLDPVTPVRNAVNMALGHPSAAVVIREGTGHCAASAPSNCIFRIIREYLDKAVMPENGTSCLPDCDPWTPCPLSVKPLYNGLLNRRHYFL